MRRRGRWSPYRMLALERGDTFASWTVRASGSAVLEARVREDFAARVIHGKNNSGAGQALAEWRKPLNTLGISNPTGYTGAHTVHVRCHVETNAGASVGFALMPATALKATAGVGDGYAARAWNAGIDLLKYVNGVVSILATFVGTIVRPGDVLSLGYQWNTAAARAELAGLVNGTVAGVHLDTSSPIDLVTQNALPGLGLTTSPSIANSRDFGHFTREWWVTDGFATFGEPAEQYPGNVGELVVALLEWQPYTDSPRPAIERLVSGQVLEAEWTHHRIGGCGALRVRFRPPDTFVGPGSSTEATGASYFVEPPGDSWTGNDWLGGEVLLGIKYDGSNLGNVVSTVLWRGRVASVGYDPDSRVVTLEGEGLIAALEESQYSGAFLDRTIREIVAELVFASSKSGTTDGRNRYVRFNLAKLVGPQSLLDQRIDIRFNLESTRTAIESVLAYLPDSFVWGVDQDGDFYLDQQADTYDNDMSGEGITTYFVDREGVDFSRELDVSQVRTRVIVTGRELSDEESQIANSATTIRRKTLGRIFAEAACVRAQQLYGTRDMVYSDGNVRDPGMAGKIAIAQLKRNCAPRFTGRLTVSQPILGLRTFYQALTRFSPRVAIVDRPLVSGSRSQPLTPLETLSGSGTEVQKVAPYLLRRYGDVDAVALGLRGSLGSGVQFASNTNERNRNRSWLLHAAFRFDWAHPGASGDYAFLFGRPQNSATLHGWGELWWKKTGASTGTLIWRYRHTGAANVELDLGISVPAAGSGTVVHLTMHRDQLGTFKAWNGNTLTLTDATHQAEVLVSTTDPWRFADHGKAAPPATEFKGDVVLDMAWAIDTLVESGRGVEAQPDGVVGFIARNQAQELHRNDGEGLLWYAPFQRRSALNVSIPVLQAGALVNATHANAGSSNATKVTTPARLGQLVSVDATVSKRWGGPLVFNCETITYKVSSAEGVVRSELTLGELAGDAFTTMAVLQDQVQKAEDALRRTRKDF